MIGSSADDSSTYRLASRSTAETESGLTIGEQLREVSHHPDA